MASRAFMASGLSSLARRVSLRASGLKSSPTSSVTARNPTSRHAHFGAVHDSMRKISRREGPAGSGRSNTRSPWGNNAHDRSVGGAGITAGVMARCCLVCHMLLSDARLYVLLLKFDEDLATAAQRGRCPVCGGRLDEGRYSRKPRGPKTVTLPDEDDQRFSYSFA